MPYGLHTQLPLTLGSQIFQELLYTGVVVDGRAGGLILGRSFSEGGIYAIHQRGHDFFIHGSTEGGDYVLNKTASAQNVSRLKAINAGVAKNDDAAPVAEALALETRFIVTVADPCDKFIWLNWCQTVVAREYTERYLAELIQMNQKGNPYALCDHDLFFPPDGEGTADGII